MPRVFLPADRQAVRSLAAGETWTPPSVVVPAPAEGPDDDQEVREFAAFLAAADASLALLPPDEHRRVVVAADLAGADGPLQLAQVASWHVDDAEGAALVARVQQGEPAALLDDAALLWYARGEVEAVLAALG